MYELGIIIPGTIEAISSFGAFILLEDGSKGMVHISQVKRGFIKDIKSELSVGQKIEAKVLCFNEEKGKYDLSIKQAIKEPNNPDKKLGPPAFELKLSKFLKESEQKQVDVRRALKRKHGIKNKNY